jgi:hypothetical protein
MEKIYHQIPHQVVYKNILLLQKAYMYTGSQSYDFELQLHE